MHEKVAKAKHLSLVSPIQLDSTDQVAGTIFRKQIMSFGRWVNPNWWWDEELWMELTPEIAQQMIDNFNAKTFGKRISVPRNHTGDVNANAGEVIKLEMGTDGLWAYLDIRDPKTASDIENGLIFDVSMGFDLDYTDQKEGLNHGAVLIHVALVTDPYLNNMDDFQKATTAELSKRYEQWAGSFGFAKSEPSLIMMSKSKVEELKSMTKKLSKVSNDKDYAVEVKYKNADGEEVTSSVGPGAEIEVPEDAKADVESQIESAEAPSEEDEPDLSGTGGQQQPAGNGGVPEGEEPAPGTEDEKAELARVRRENAELKANQEYSRLLALGKITPAQKDLFLSLAKSGNVTLSANVPKLNLTKGKTTSVATLLSAILEAGPQVVKLGEKGGKGEKVGDGQVELTEEQEAKVKRMGFSIVTFKKQVKAGNIKLSVLDEEK